MKCLSLWQPWASLLFSPGEFRKEFETRPRAMGIKVGETIAIHAAKTLDGFRALDQIRRDDRFVIRQSLAEQFPEVKPGELWQNVLPFGAIVGVLTIGGMNRVEEIRDVITERERAFGDFRDGRFAIATVDPVKFAEPIPFKGLQGVFFVPAHVLNQESAA